VMGDVLRFYFGAALPREPDDMYLSVDAAPYAFRRVDFAWLAGKDRSVGPGKKQPVADCFASREISGQED
jgi:hypothetical protein